jgi:hypothetical protein
MPIANPIFAIIFPSHTKKGIKTTGFFPLLSIVPVASIYSRVHLLLSTTSMHTFFDGAILWPPGQTIQQTQIYKGCCYTPPCLDWSSFGFEVKWAKVRGGYVNLSRHAMTKM